MIKQRVYSESGKPGYYRISAHHPDEIFKEVQKLEVERAKTGDPFAERVDMKRFAQALGIWEKVKSEWYK